MTLEATLGQIHRESFGRLVATLTRLTRDLELAEDVVQEAFERALANWDSNALPENPIAWLARAARNAAIDRFRQQRLHADRVDAMTRESELETTDLPMDQNPVLRDDMLRLIFTCCHPALALETRVALSLRTLGGLETAEIARAFLIPEATLAQRIVRAKRKILKAGIAYRVPDADELSERLPSVLSVVYLIFNEAYLATRGEGAVRLDLADQAIRLARTLCGVLPERSEAQSLLAILLLQHSRRDARIDADGNLVLLADQDRTRWDRAQIEEGTAIVRQVFEGGYGRAPFALQAAIAALHAAAEDPASTDWPQVCALYENLMEFDPSPVVALNHAVAIGERDGPEAGLAWADRLRESAAMQGYHLYHATRADLLRRMDRAEEAALAYQEALAHVENEVERRFLEGRLRWVRRTLAGDD